LTRFHWLSVGSYSLLITVAVLGAFALAFTWLGMEQDGAVTVSFLTLAFAQLWHVFNMRDRDSGFIDNEIVRNPWVWGALALCTALLIAAVYLPGLSSLLSVVNPGVEGWLLVMAASALPWLIGQVFKAVADAQQERGLVSQTSIDAPSGR
jgi:Ca2+-transporting ATPase